MFDNLNILAFGLVSFAILIGVGSIVLANFGNSVGGVSNTTVQYLLGYLGTQSGGLANWTPAIIAISVGFLFLSFFGFGRKKKR